MEVGRGEREIIYLSLHCHHQNDSCIKMGSDESHFNVSVGSDGQSHRTVSTDISLCVCHYTLLCLFLFSVTAVIWRGGGSSGTGRGVEVVIATRHTVECVCERCRQGQVRARHQASSTAVEYQRSAIVVWLL